MSQRVSQKKPKVKWVKPTPEEEAEQLARLYAERYENPFTAANRNINVGDRVRQVGWFADYDRKNKGRTNFDGTVTEIYPHNPNDPIPEHGFITVVFDDGSDGDFVDYSKEDLLVRI